MGNRYLSGFGFGLVVGAFLGFLPQVYFVEEFSDIAHQATRLTGRAYLIAAGLKQENDRLRQQLQKHGELPPDESATLPPQK